MKKIIPASKKAVQIRKVQRTSYEGKSRIALLAIFLVLTITSANAQLTGWQYKDAITIQENSGVQKRNYQVLLTINTQAFVTLGRMQASGNDLRFAKNCSGSILYNYWIESGMNTATTYIWVMIDTLAASGTRIINMYYGNNTAPVASNFTATFPNRRVSSGAEVISDSVWNYDWVEIPVGSPVTLSPSHPAGKLVINARRIIINDSLRGDGVGYAGGTIGIGAGPGGGGQNGGPTVGGGGGGYGGAGGHGGGPSYGAGGITYGSSNSPVSIEKGSGGGKGGATSGGNGGGCFELNGTYITIGGKITARGLDGGAGWYTGGGGSGGGIMIKGYRVIISGNMLANGGKGGSSPSNTNGGGGGGGGRIKIFYENFYSNTGTNNVAGGIHQSSGVLAQNGFLGTVYSGTFISGIPTYTIMPHVVLTASGNPVCQGSSVTFTGSTGFSNYNFYVNGSSAQNSAVNTYTTSTLANGNTVEVRATYAGSCLDQSNVITMTVNGSPVVTIAPVSATICSGSSQTLTASGANSYSWTPSGSLNTSAGSTVIASPTITTTYTVTGTGGNGCTNISTVTVTVNPQPSTPVITANGTTTFCQGGSVQLTSSSPADNLWSNGATTQTITVSGSGNYSVTVTNANGCSASSAPTTVTVNSNPPTPIISSSGSTTFCQGDSIQLTSSSSTNNTWSNNEITQSITIFNSGNYFVTVTDANGCSSVSATTSTTVNPSPASPAATSNSPICAGNTLNLSASTIAGAAYDWSGPGGFSESSQNPSITNAQTNATGTYSVTASLGACTSSAGTVLVTVNSPPATPVASASSPVCEGATLNLFSTTVAGANYTWTGPDNFNSTAQNPSINNVTPLAAGTYTVVANNGCASSPSTVTVFVNPLPPAPTITPNGPLTFCQGGSVQLSSSSAVNYLWSNNATTQTIAVNSSGNYFVTITDGNGCSATSAGNTVTVNPLPVVSFSGLNGGYCTANASVTLTGSPTGGTFSGPGISGNNFDPATAGTGTHTIAYSYTDANGCSNSASQNTVISSNAFVNLGLDAILCTIDQLTLNAGNFSSYVWQDNSTASTFVVDGPTLGTGVYTFYVDVVDANSCTGTDTIIISVIVCSTGMTEYGAMEVSVSPNPTDGIFNISIANPGSDKIQLEMMTVDGKIAYAGSITKMAGEQVDVSNLSKGIYILKISDGKEIIVQKIVLQ